MHLSWEEAVAGHKRERANCGFAAEIPRQLALCHGHATNG
jgi:hypothetical protein